MSPPTPRTPGSPAAGQLPGHVDGGTFRSLMGRFATGVTVVTASHRGHDAGMTVNAFLSVTLEPPTVLVALNAKADTTPVVEASGRFSVNLLSSRQRHVSELFASRLPSSDKFQGIGFHRSPRGQPLLDGTLGSLECEVVQRIPCSTHLLLLGRVVAMEEGGPELPLVFWKSEYAKPSQGGGLVMSPARRPEGPKGGSSSRPVRSRSTGRAGKHRSVGKGGRGR